MPRGSLLQSQRLQRSLRALCYLCLHGYVALLVYHACTSITIARWEVRKEGPYV